VKKKSRRHIILFCILLLSLLFPAGCAVQKADISTDPYRLVTEIYVSYQQDGHPTEKNFTQANKMRAVLNYLRWIDPYGAPEEDPLTIPGSSIHIQLHYSDGSEKAYLQKADRFMMEDNHRWKKIDPEKAPILTQILNEMESDGLA